MPCLLDGLMPCLVAGLLDALMACMWHVACGMLHVAWEEGEMGYTRLCPSAMPAKAGRSHDATSRAWPCVAHVADTKQGGVAGTWWDWFGAMPSVAKGKSCRALGKRTHSDE